jgi:hypothetical protein
VILAILQLNWGFECLEVARSGSNYCAAHCEGKVNKLENKSGRMTTTSSELSENVSYMKLLHELKAAFPTLPDEVVSQCINQVSKVSIFVNLAFQFCVSCPFFCFPNFSIF